MQLSLRVEAFQRAGGLAGADADQASGLVREQHQQLGAEHRPVGQTARRSG